VTSRLERILVSLARRHAPQLLEPEKIDAPTLARRLADYNILILVGDPGKSSIQAALPDIQTWVDGYTGLYDLLTRNLFSMFTNISASYADGELPAIILINGTATPVMQQLAGYVAPYIAKRQGRRDVTDVELTGLMDIILDELEANDLPREEYRQLRAAGVQALREMLNAPVRQLPLLPFDHHIFGDLSQEPEVTPSVSPPASPPEVIAPLPEPGVQSPLSSAPVEQRTAPPKPDTLPQTPPPTPEAPPIDEPPLDPFDSSIPVFFELPKRGTKRRPPVPDLPEDKT